MSIRSLLKPPAERRASRTQEGPVVPQGLLAPRIKPGSSVQSRSRGPRRRRRSLPSGPDTYTVEAHVVAALVPASVNRDRSRQTRLTASPVDRPAVAPASETKPPTRFIGPFAYALRRPGFQTSKTSLGYISTPLVVPGRKRPNPASLRPSPRPLVLVTKPPEEPVPRPTAEQRTTTPGPDETTPAPGPVHRTQPPRHQDTSRAAVPLRNSSLLSPQPRGTTPVAMTTTLEVEAPPPSKVTALHQGSFLGHPPIESEEEEKEEEEEREEEEEEKGPPEAKGAY